MLSTSLKKDTQISEDPLKIPLDEREIYRKEWLAYKQKRLSNLHHSEYHIKAQRTLHK
jgi:hypothetical protein